MGAAFRIKEAGRVEMLAPWPHLGPTHVKVRPDFWVVYRANYIGHPKGIKKVSSKATKHGFSEFSRKNLSRALDMFFFASRERIIYNSVIHRKHPFVAAFITLTFPKKIKRIDGNKLLNRFLSSTIGRNDIYVWKAEYQENGQLHYHIITSKFIPYNVIRANWNKALKENGLLDAYAKKHGHFNPNSTDVTAVYKMKDLAEYIKKYMSKEGPPPKGGRAWGCSRVLLQAQFFEFVEDDYPEVSRKEAKVYEHFSLIKAKPSDLPLPLFFQFTNWKNQLSQKMVK